MRFLYAHFLIMSVLAFILYGVDKRRAVHHLYRIPEAVLLFVGFFGGGVGAVLGMRMFHHKTRRWYFWVVNVLSMIMQALIYAALIRR